MHVLQEWRDDLRQVGKYSLSFRIKDLFDESRRNGVVIWAECVVPALRKRISFIDGIATGRRALTYLSIVRSELTTLAR